jgi:hypothetical protein
MSKEERYTYHCDQYDYVEIIYDNEGCEEIDSMKMAEKRLNRQQDKISDLEAKLAESNESHHKNIVELTKIATEKDRKIEELKQQLAEKDDEITQRLVIQERDYIQDKISFAVEYINKIKKDLYENEKINIRACDFDEIDNIFDNQINVLRNNKDGIH